MSEQKRRTSTRSSSRPRRGRNPSQMNKRAEEPERGTPTAPAAQPRAQQPKKGPKRVRFGVKLKAPEEFAAPNEVAAQWLKSLETMVDPDGRQEGFEYARQGQTISLDVAAGIVRADVQGRRGKPYSVRILFPTLSEAEWNRLIDSMAGEAMCVAKLLAGELPDRFNAMLDSLGLPLFAGARATCRARCTCGYDRPCKHVAAVGYLLTETLSSDSLTVLTLLGMPSGQVIDQLRQARVLKTQGIATAHPDQLASLMRSAPPPLEACVDEFWRPGPQLAELERSPLPHHAPHALLRRMGPSPLSGRFPMVGLLASVYDTVTEAAIGLRDRAERGEGV